MLFEGVALVQNINQIPQTGLALMGFSRYCPSSLDLTNFVVRECRGATAEAPRRSGRAGPSPSRPGPGLDLGIWKSGDLEIQKFGIQKMENIKTLKIQIRSVQNVGKVWISRKQNLPAPFGAISDKFFYGPKQIKTLLNFCLFPVAVHWALFTRFGVI